MNKIFGLLVGAGLSAGFCLGFGLSANAQGLPLDKSVVHGKLKNGLSYFLLKNTEPKNRATLYLVTKAGSILEKDDQQGLAHFMEHMSFNGTKHFPKNELINYLEKSGIRFGADLNAYTSFDETVYQLPIPTDDPSIVKNGLQILRDWAQDAVLDPAEINGERGVVLEEKRLHLGASQRIQDLTLPLLLNHSIYAQRLPIGKEQVLKTFRPETIRSFYKDWYRPDLQAVIIVGDVDVNAMELNVKALFSDLKMPAVVRNRTAYSVELDGKNKFLALTDPELTQTTVDLSFKLLEQVNKTEADFRSSLVRSLFSGMLSGRLAELGKKPDAPFLSLSGGLGGFMGGLDALSVQLVPRKGELKTGFLAAWREVVRIKRFGFTDAEFSRQKAELVSALDAGLKEKDKQNSTALADQLKLYFLKGEAYMGTEGEHALAVKLLSGISLAEVNKLAVALLKDKDRDVIITAPVSEKAGLPSEDSVNGWMAEVEKSALTHYTEDAAGKDLMSALPVRGKVVSEKTIPEIGVTEWTLSNGAKVVVKPTNFKNDEVSFLALSPGGTSLYGDRDYQSAANAAGIIGSFGLGGFDNIALPKMLAGKQVAVSPFIGDRVEGLQGESTVKDLRTALELVHLYFTAPRRDTALFAQVIRNSAEAIATRSLDPDVVFGDTISAVLGAYNVRRTAPTLEKLHAIDLDKVVSIYKQRFANAGDFTFFFVGSMNLDSLKEQVEQYIGSLPAVGGVELAKDLGIRTPSGKIAKTVLAGKEDKADVRLVYTGDFSFSAEHNLELGALQEILQYRLTERLRETEGGVYTPGVSVSKSKYPVSRYSFVVSFGCSPANVEKLIAATHEEIAKMKSGILAADLQKFKAEEVRQNELASKDNGFWLNYLSSQYADGEDPKSFLGLNARIQGLNVGDLQKAAALYFNESNVIRFVLLPQMTGKTK